MNFREFLFLAGFLREPGVLRIGDFRKHYIVKRYYRTPIVQTIRSTSISVCLKQLHKEAELLNPKD